MVCLRRVIIAMAAPLAVFASSAVAAEPGKDDKPVTQKEPTASDVVETPATDLNIKRDEIPPLLVTAQERPYALRGLDTCRQLSTAIRELDGVLGDDVDVPQSEGRRTSPGRVAQSVIGSFIPFRGLIREISGANAHDRALQAAVIAGVARRSFLKGIGQAKGCRYPARSATLDIYNAHLAAANAKVEPRKLRPENAEPQRRAREASRNAPPVRYVSRPVVQQTD